MFHGLKYTWKKIPCKKNNHHSNNTKIWNIGTCQLSTNGTHSKENKTLCQVFEFGKFLYWVPVESQQVLGSAHFVPTYIISFYSFHSSNDLLRATRTNWFSIESLVQKLSISLVGNIRVQIKAHLMWPLKTNFSCKEHILIGISVWKPILLGFGGYIIYQAMQNRKGKWGMCHRGNNLIKE